MSLQHAAKHLAAHGRGKDTELIHMDKGEIASLQQIAKANGGSLTINPQTGLPEAGFLSAILPMVAGAALTGLSGGVINPMTAGFLVGGLRTAQSGSLSKGIMAGFGAYGGAGLAQSFGAAGAGSTTTLDGSAIANPPPVTPTPTPTPASNVIDVSGSSLPQVGGPIEPSSIIKTPLESMTNVQDPYASAGFEGSGRPPGFETTPNVTGRPLSDPMYSDYGGATKGIPTQTYEVAPKSFADMTPSERISAMGRGASFENAYDYAAANPKSSLVAATGVAMGMQKGPPKPAEPDRDMGQRYSFTGGKYEPAPAPDVPTYDEMLYGGGNFGRQRQYFNSPTYTAISPTAAKDLYNFAGGGMPVEQMSNNAAMGANTMYPMANTATSSFATPYQAPQSTNMLANMVAPSGGGAVNAMSGEPSMQGTRMAEGGIASYRIGGDLNVQDAPDDQPVGPIGRLLGMTRRREQDANPGLGYMYNQDDQQYVQQQATGGISDAHYNLGGYSDGGRLLRGPGDGVSDSIPAVIGKKQPARLADGEFVVPARIVSELGNGSTEAGARKLYAMLDRVQASRKRTIGKGKVAKNNRADKYLPA